MTKFKDGDRPFHCVKCGSEVTPSFNPLSKKQSYVKVSQAYSSDGGLWSLRLLRIFSVIFTKSEPEPQ